jgi:hypothetical protein
VELPGPVTLRAVHIYESDTKTLVTSIEVLSPVNKIGEGLREYRQKRSRLLHSDVHLVEIDLLRRGERPGRELAEPPLDTDYVVLVNRNRDSNRRISDIWPIELNEALPTIPIPLLPPDADAVLDLAAVVAAIYSTFHYELRIDYTQPTPPPPLRPAMQAWLDQQP